MRMDMCYHVITISRWDDFVQGLNIAANIGSVECHPERTLVVAFEQLEAIKKAGIKYENGPKKNRKTL